MKVLLEDRCLKCHSLRASVYYVGPGWALVACAKCQDDVERVHEFMFKWFVLAERPPVEANRRRPS